MEDYSMKVLHHTLGRGRRMPSDSRGTEGSNDSTNREWRQQGEF